jgi:hypothetical protein
MGGESHRHSFAQTSARGGFRGRWRLDGDRGGGGRFLTDRDQAASADSAVWPLRTAQAMLDAVREIKNAINAGEVSSYGQLHNQWSDQVLAPARIIRSEGLETRAEAGLYVIFLATLVPENDITYPVLRGTLDVEEWLESWLRRNDPPPAHLPRCRRSQTSSGTPGGAGSISNRCTTCSSKGLEALTGSSSHPRGTASRLGHPARPRSAR